MIIFQIYYYFFFPVSECSGGHDPLFRKGVRRGVKARFQNVFDVGGFYVECESEKPGPGSGPGSGVLPSVGTGSIFDKKDDENVGMVSSDIIEIMDKNQNNESTLITVVDNETENADDLSERIENKIQENEQKNPQKTVRSRTAARTLRRTAAPITMKKTITEI